MTKHMVLRVKDDAYFYKILGEKNRIAEMLYEIRETVNKNFKQYSFVKDIGYFLNKNESTYEYVVTIAYETDEPDEPDSKPTLVLIKKNRKFTMNVKKQNYYENYDEVFTELKSSIEKDMDRKIEKYFDEHRDYTITNKESEWVEEDDANVLVVNVTYTAPYVEEKVKDEQT